MASVEVGDEAFVGRLIQQIAPYHGRIQQADVKVHEGVVGMLAHLGINPRHGGSREGRLRFGVGDAQMPDVAARDELAPAQRFKGAAPELRGAAGIAPLGEAKLGARDIEPRGHQRFIEDANRGGRLGDAVDDSHRAVALQPAAGRTHLDGLLERLAGILTHEVEQRFGAEPVDEDRLVVRDHPYVEKGTLWRQGDEQIDRRARETGYGREIGGFEDIGDELVARRVLLEDRPDGNLVILLAENIGRWKMFLEIGARQLTRLRPARGDQRNDQRNKRGDDAQSRHVGFPRMAEKSTLATSITARVRVNTFSLRRISETCALTVVSASFSS